MIFQRRGSHSRVFDHDLAELVQPRAAALAAGARRRFDDPFDRQIVRQRASRRPRILRSLLLGGLRRGDLGLGSCSAWVSSRSSIASSSCSTSSLPRSEDCPNCSRRALASISFSRSISSRPTWLHSSPRSSASCRASCSRCARIIACAAARSAGSGSEGVVTMTIQPYLPAKIAPDQRPESKSRSSTGRLRTPCFLRHPPVNSGQKIGQLRTLIVTTPSASDGHRNRPRSSLFVNRHAPWPSCQMILIRSPRRPLKQYRLPRGDRASVFPAPAMPRLEAFAHVGMAGRKPDTDVAR